MFTPRCDAGTEVGRQLRQQFVEARRHRAGLAAVAGLAFLLAAAEQRIEFLRHQFAVRVELVQQGRHAGQAHGGGHPVQVVVLCRQHMGLLIVEVLDAVLDPAQEVIGLGQRFGAGLGHQPGPGQTRQRIERGARAQFGKLAAANHLQQLHDELDLADAAAPELDVVGPLGAAAAALVRVLADLPVQHAQRVEHAVIEVAPEDKGQHHLAQALRGAPVGVAELGHDPALEPGKALPFAALHVHVLLQRAERNRRRTRVAVRAQRQIDAKDKAVLGGVADQGVDRAHRLGEVLLVRDAAAPLGIAAGFAVLVVDVDQVDVARDVEFACAELAHADDPEQGARAAGGRGFAVALRQGLLHVAAGLLQGKFGQVGHGLGHLLQAGPGIAVQAQQAFEHQLAGDAQGAGAVAAAGLQGRERLRHRALIRQTRRQQVQLAFIAAAHALAKARVQEQSRAGHNSCHIYGFQ